MNILRTLIVIAVAAGGYHYWKQRHEHAAPIERGPTTEGGFVTLLPAGGQNPQTVYVVAAENGPHAEAQRADRLAEDLSRAGIPVERTHDVRFRFTSRPDGEVMERMNKIMNGPLPAVFIRGRAKSNPSLDEVVAEYKGER
jgi:hypothetical protein